MTAPARALLDEARRHDAAMTAAPWRWDDDDDAFLGENGLEAFGQPTYEGNHGIVINPEDAAGIAWLRNNLRALLDGYASALDEIDRLTWQAKVWSEIDAGRDRDMAFTDRSLTDAIEQGDSWRTQAQEMAARVRRMDGAMQRMRAAVAKVRDDLAARTENGFYGYSEDLDAILDEGTP